jgi:oxygen-independent coproporphyrinogen-3 oxidase
VLTGRAEMIEAIGREAFERKNYLPDKQIQSIYFGGGTPSLLTFSELLHLMKGFSQHFVWEKNAEITLEANPDDISSTSLVSWKDLGVNRLSIGIQSFNNDELRWMNRAHDAEQSVDSVKLAQDKGFDNVSIDLIYGSRYQDMRTWEKTLKMAIDLGTAHISSYNLTIEKKTVLGLLKDRGTEPSVNEEMSRAQFDLMREMLRDAGFEHYEISNFGKPGKWAVHNSNYWKSKPYLGLGPSAHSFNGNSRQWNAKNNAVYVRELQSGGRFFEKEELTDNNRYNEYVLTRLRTIWGCDLGEIRSSFGAGFAEYFLEKAERKKEFLAEKDGVFTLKERGLFLADGIASDLFVV